MLTIESLRSFGADVNEGLGRCMNNEGFYLRMVRMACADGNFEKLEKAVEENNLTAGFEAAHALKGVLANLSLTPLSGPVSELTERLRAGTPGDYRQTVGEILKLRDELKALDR